MAVEVERSTFSLQIMILGVKMENEGIGTWLQIVSGYFFYIS